MNYFMKCQLLSEGFKHEQLHEQLIEEDWEKLKKELTDLYVAGKITERQISTRLARAGMGSLSKNTAYKIAHDPENFQKREAVFSRARKEEEEKAKGEAKAAQVAKHQTRGFAAANYSSQANMDAWLKAANEYRARKEKERQNLSRNFTKSLNNHEVSNIVKEEVITEEVLLESINSKIEKIKSKIIKLKSKTKKAYKQGKISTEDFEKVKNICDRVEQEMITYEGRKFKGYTKSQVKMRVNKTLTEINKLLGDKLIIQILKNAGCFAFFTAVLYTLFIVSLSSVGVATSTASIAAGAGVASIGGAAFTKLTKKILNKFRELGVRFDNFESNIINTFSNAKNSLTDVKNHGTNSDNIANTSLKEEVNYFNY